MSDHSEHSQELSPMDLRMHGSLSATLRKSLPKGLIDAPEVCSRQNVPDVGALDSCPYKGCRARDLFSCGMRDGLSTNDIHLTCSYLLCGSPAYLQGGDWETWLTHSKRQRRNNNRVCAHIIAWMLHGVAAIEACFSDAVL